jgi:outer membrane protein assembly factor BamB
MLNELSYVGQQLWPNFATFIAQAQRIDKYNNRNKESFKKEAQGLVFFATEDGKLYAIDAQTGQLRWNYEGGDSIVSSPVAANSTLYFGSWAKKLLALDVLSGELKWSYETEGEINSAPVVISETVCFGSWDGRLYALDAISGRLKWTCETHSRILCSPAARSSMVYFGSEDGTWYAVDIDTGDIKWSYTRELAGEDDKELGYRCAGVANALVYFIGTDDKLYALDAENGQHMWTYYDKEAYEEDSLGGVDNVCVGQEGLALCSGSSIGVCLLDGKTGELVWSRKELGEVGTTISGSLACIADGAVYAFADEMIVAFDVMTAKVIWRYSLKDITFTDLVPSVMGRIICFALGKELLALDAMTGDYRWSYECDEEISTSPTIWLRTT